MQDGVFGVLFLRNDLLHKKEILVREKKEILTRGKKRFDETEKVRDNGNLLGQRRGGRLFGKMDEIFFSDFCTEYFKGGRFLTERKRAGRILLMKFFLIRYVFLCYLKNTL